MPTYTSPVSTGEFKTYLNDTTTDTGILAFYQSLLDMATEKVYTYLDRDYTPGAVKTDVFFGNEHHIHRMRDPAATLTSWKSYDSEGAETIHDISGLVLMANGNLVVCAKGLFDQGSEHRIKYTLPNWTVPETIRQVIIEIAAIVFEESKSGGGRLGIAIETDRIDSSTERLRYLDLTKRQQITLAPYKRIAV